MTWQPRDLTLSKLEPAQGKVGANLKVQATGTGFGQGIQLILIREGVSDGLTPPDVLVCNNVKITKGNFNLTFELPLDGVNPGTYCAIAWNLPLKKGEPSERYVLEGAFVVNAST